MSKQQHSDKLQEIDLAQLKQFGAINAPLGKTTKREGEGFTLKVCVTTNSHPVVVVEIQVKSGWRLPHSVVRHSVKTKAKNAQTWKMRRRLSERGKARLEGVDREDQIVQFE